MDKAEQLDQIKQDIINGNICPELAAQAHNLVMGDGNLNAEVVFIGEAPGKNEDEQGLPFVGAAGKFLNEMLAHAEMNRSDVYITNIVKYRPPNNRDPLPEEKAAFWPFLWRQLDIIKPKIVATLGRHSMEYFLPDAKISTVHGRPKRISIEFDGQELSIVVLPLFHPAAALYNGAMRETLMDDFAKLPDILKRVQDRDFVLSIMTEGV